MTTGRGLKVVPIVMAAEIMMGVYFNLSFWYKLIDKTIWGGVVLGSWLPGACPCQRHLRAPLRLHGLCVWAGFAGYGTAMLLSYFVGQRHYPIHYPVKEMLLCTVAAAIVLCALMRHANAALPIWAAVGVNTLLLAVFAAIIIKRDFPIGEILKKVRR